MPPNGGASKKRTAPSVSSAQHSTKRVKMTTARTILTETNDKALKENGELDVAAFVKAREFEIRALEDGMRASKGNAATRAFQQVPRELRRRTASHNVKRVPKRFRARAAREVRRSLRTTIRNTK